MAAKIIECKFNIGDVVYVIENRIILENTDMVCPVCNGTGNFIKPDINMLVDCPGINGYYCSNGKIKIRSMKYKPREIHICSITVDSDGIQYDNEDSYESYNEDELFVTLDEAQIACDVMNNNRKDD